MRALLLSLCLVAGPALAGVDEVLTDHVAPGVSRFAAASAALADAARTDCRAEALRPAYQTAFDAWMGVGHLQFGPLEAEGRGLAIAFWPDTRGIGARAVAGLIAEADPAVNDPEAFAEVSVAARGLFALDGLLYGDPYDAQSYTCRLVAAIAADMARMAAGIEEDWRAHADLLRSAGAPGNSVYLAPDEAAQTLYTALMTGLEFTRDQRLGRPMGSFDRPRPKRAEAWRSGRSLANVRLSLIALRDLALSLSDAPIPRSEAAFEEAIATAETLEDPVFAGVADPTGRLRVEVLQQAVNAVHEAVAAEIGAPLGLSQGFNSQDGD